jgi:hypothetical protein
MTAGQIPLAVGLRELAVRGVLSTVDDPEALAAQVELGRERTVEAQMQAMLASVERDRQAPDAEAEDEESPEDDAEAES